MIIGSVRRAPGDTCIDCAPTTRHTEAADTQFLICFRPKTSGHTELRSLFGSPYHLWRLWYLHRPSDMEARPHLRSLADRFGILPAYFDIAGVQRVACDETRVAFLGAMGVDASTEAAAARGLESLQRAEGQRMLAPVRVVVARPKQPPEIQLILPTEDLSPIDWRIELREENGLSHVAAGRSSPREATRAVTVTLPVSPPPGYHTLRASVCVPGHTLEAEQLFIVSPGRCTAVLERLGDSRAYGVWANLYTVRSNGNWGLGDLTDLGKIVRHAGTRGAAFVGVNPLHALRNRSEHISPYCPVSRLFRNAVYLDVEDVPEFADCREAQDLLASEAFQAELTKLRSAEHVQYERVAVLKNQILRLLHGVFLQQHANGSTSRARAYDRYVATQGRPLVDHATFVALESWLAENDEGAEGWHAWPTAYRSPDSAEVQAFRNAGRKDVDFHCYIQYELDRQLAAAADKARLAGMPLGIYQDLAVGSAAYGSDAWAFPDLFVPGVEVGAPPDPYCDAGQTWGFPPLHPRRLTANRYEYWIHLVRNTMAHAGMLRIDHVMGLFRQFWVPIGCDAVDGAYVRYPAEDMLGILALESQRHGTIVVGEDLGTVPPEVPPTLAEWQILSSAVMYFERDAEGRFRPAETYSPRALVTATTHDHAPLAGFLTGRDLDIRHEIGLLNPGADLEEARAERANTRAALLDIFLETGLLPSGDSEAVKDIAVQSVIEAAYAFLARTPCPLVGVSLDDLACEADPVNLPGVGHTRYRSWSRRMRCHLEEIFDAPRVHGILDCIREVLKK